MKRIKIRQLNGFRIFIVNFVVKIMVMASMTPYTKFPYIPDLSRVFSYYCQIVNSEYDSEMENDIYYRFLFDNNFLQVSGSIVEPSGSFDLADESTRERSFLSYLNSPDDTRLITESIGDNGKSLDELTSSLEDKIAPNDIYVILSWLEHLNQVKYKEDKYVLTNDIAEDLENRESIYPLNYKETLDISEDKFSVFEYLRKIKSGKIKMNPDFQRNVVWKPRQKSRFIESTILQIPIPPFYMKRRSDGSLVIIDGLQRTTALSEYLNNEFALCDLEALSELNDKTFHDLEEWDSTVSTKIEDKQLMFYILGTSVPMVAVYDIFNRINTGGTRLERQEVRNCVFIGNATAFLKRIVDAETFKKAIDGGISDNRMKAREAILRCIAFVVQPVSSYQGSIDEFLEKAMKKLNAMSSIEIGDLERKTLQTFDLTYEFFGKTNFRIPGRNTRGRINVAVMEVIFNCFWEKESSDFPKKSIVVRSFENLLKDNAFLDSFRISTSSKNGVKTRFELAHQYLDYDK